MRHVLACTLMALMLVGCASQPVAVTREPRAGVVSTHWEQDTVARWQIARDDGVWVCFENQCDKPAPEALVREVGRWGFKLAATREEAKYLLGIRAYLTKSVATRDGESVVAPIPAWPLLAQEDAQTKVRSWGRSEQPRFRDFGGSR